MPIMDLLPNNEKTQTGISAAAVRANLARKLMQTNADRLGERFPNIASQAEAFLHAELNFEASMKLSIGALQYLVQKLETSGDRQLALAQNYLFELEAVFRLYTDTKIIETFHKAANEAEALQALERFCTHPHYNDIQGHIEKLQQQEADILTLAKALADSHDDSPEAAAFIKRGEAFTNFTKLVAARVDRQREAIENLATDLGHPNIFTATEQQQNRIEQSQAIVLNSLAALSHTKNPDKISYLRELCLLGIKVERYPSAGYPELHQLLQTALIANTKGLFDENADSSLQFNKKLDSREKQDLYRKALGLHAGGQLNPNHFDVERLQQLYKQDGNPVWLVFKNLAPLADSNQQRVQTKIDDLAELSRLFQDSKLGKTDKYSIPIELAEKAYTIAEQAGHLALAEASFGPETALGRWFKDKLAEHSAEIALPLISRTESPSYRAAILREILSENPRAYRQLRSRHSFEQLQSFQYPGMNPANIKADLKLMLDDLPSEISIILGNSELSARESAKIAGPLQEIFSAEIKFTAQVRTYLYEISQLRDQMIMNGGDLSSINSYQKQLEKLLQAYERLDIPTALKKSQNLDGCIQNISNLFQSDAFKEVIDCQIALQEQMAAVNRLNPALNSASMMFTQKMMRYVMPLEALNKELGKINEQMNAQRGISRPSREHLQIQNEVKALDKAIACCVRESLRANRSKAIQDCQEHIAGIEKDSPESCIRQLLQLDTEVLDYPSDNSTILDRYFRTILAKIDPALFNAKKSELVQDKLPKDLQADIKAALGIGSNGLVNPLNFNVEAIGRLQAQNPHPIWQVLMAMSPARNSSGANKIAAYGAVCRLVQAGRFGGEPEEQFALAINIAEAAHRIAETQGAVEYGATFGEGSEIEAWFKERIIDNRASITLDRETLVRQPYHRGLLTELVKNNQSLRGSFQQSKEAYKLIDPELGRDSDLNETARKTH